MQNDMIKLNVLLHKEKGLETNLQQSNILMENDFIGSLKVRLPFVFSGVISPITCDRITVVHSSGLFHITPPLGEPSTLLHFFSL